MFFIIPLSAYSLIGTTDTKYDGDLDEVHADRDDVNYLLSESRRILPTLNLTKEAILYTYAGLRPLAFSGTRESKISRKHRVIKEGRTGRIITIAGGKYTTYRNMAEDAVDAACKALGVRTFCISDKKPFPGGLPLSYDAYMRDAVPELSARYHVDAETVGHLVRCYGSRAERVLDMAHQEPRLGQAISPENRDLYAQVAYSVIEEGAKTLSDIVLRRMHLGITASRGEPSAAMIAEIAGKELRWSKEERQHRVQEFTETLKKDRAF